MKNNEYANKLSKRKILQKKELIRITRSRIECEKINRKAIAIKICNDEKTISLAEVDIENEKLAIATRNLALTEEEDIVSNVNGDGDDKDDGNQTHVFGMIKQLLESSITCGKSLTPILTINEDCLRRYHLWENTIRLSHMVRDKNSVMYDAKADLGDNLKGNISSNFLEISKISNQFLLLLGNLDDWKTEGKLPEFIVPYSLSKNVGIDEYVVIMLASNQPKEHKTSSYWSEDFVNCVESNFNKTVKGDGKKHHGSVGTYFGLGTTARYTLNGDTSYGQVAHKSGVDPEVSQHLEEMIMQDIDFMIKELNWIIESIVQGGQCVTQALVDHSLEIGLSSERIPCFNSGMVCAYVCKNAQTNDFHIEKDCSYTMIGVPISAQEINCAGKFQFQFQWNKNGGNINVKLQQGTVLYYSGFAIMHRQFSSLDKCNDSCDYKFWNLSTYGNKRLYENVMKSFNRILCKNHNSID